MPDPGRPHRLELGHPLAFVPRVLAAMLLAAGLLATPACAWAVSTITAAVPGEFPPQYNLKGNGEPTGFAIDVMDRVADMAGLQVRYLVMEGWPQAHEALRTGEVDVIPNMGITDRRKDFAEFTSPVETFPVSLFVRSDYHQIKGEEDLAGHKVVVVKVNAGYALLKDRDGLELVLAHDRQDALFMLLAGQVDALAYPEPLILMDARAADVEGRIRTVGNPLLEVKRGIAVAKGREDLLRRLDEAVVRFVASEEYRDVYVKWYGAPKPFLTLARMAVVLSGAAVLLLFILGRNRRLRRDAAEMERRVRERTVELRESEEKFFKIFNSAPVMITLTSVHDGTILDANDMFFKVSGFSREESIGRTSVELGWVEESDRLGMVEELRARGRVEAMRLAVAAKDKRRIHCLYNGETIVVRGRECLLSIAQDISEVVRAEQALRDLVETTVGRSGQEALDHITEEMCRQLDLDAALVGELVGGDTVVTRAAIVDGASVPEFSYRLAGTPCGNVTDQGACLYPQGVGRLFPEDTLIVEMGMEGYVGTPLRSRQGAVVGVLCGLSRKCLRSHPMWRDFLTLVGAKAAEELERRAVEGRIVQAKEAAEAASRAKSEFLANMSHEIRTPLNGIMGMLQLMQMGEPKPEQAELISNAMLSARRLTRLLADILDLSRVEAGRMVMVAEEFNLDDVFQSVSDLVGLGARDKGLGFSAHVDPRLPSRLVGDAARLQQILFNLVGNAIKFTNSGQVTVEAYPLRHPDPTRQRILFAVSDTGRGMADDILARVFEPFTQADGGYDRGYEGAGLGLSIVKRLVELMGGNISMASEPGVGTEAYFSVVFGLPQVAGQSRQAEEAAALGPEGRRILLVEDDLMSRNALARLLAKKGHGVTSVENGKLALEALAREPFDLVLMDVKMPVMDGSEATRRIRSDTSGRFDPGIPVIAVTAYAMDGDRERFLAEGMDDYVAKPVDAKELDAAIERATAGGKAPWERPNRRADG